MSVRLINKTYGLEPPLKVKVLRDWRGHKKGAEFTVKTQKELRGAILQAIAGNFEVEGFTENTIKEYNETQAALTKGFPTGPEPEVMTTKGPKQEVVEQLKEAGFEEAESDEKPLLKKRAKKPTKD